MRINKHLRKKEIREVKEEEKAAAKRRLRRVCGCVYYNRFGGVVVDVLMVRI